MTDATTTVRTVEHGDASELPAITWGWRRGYVFALTVALCVFVWFASGRIHGEAALHDLCRICLALIGLLIFVYVAGATATDVVSLVSAVRTTRKETITEAAPPATISTPQAVVHADPPDPTQFGGPRP